MAASWARNEVDAAKRQCDLLIRYLSADGLLTPAPPGTDFIAAGAVFVSGVTAPDYALALGTLVNKRRPLAVANDVVETVDTGDDTLELTAHGYETGDGPFIADEDLGTIPTGTDFWIIKDDANNIAIASSLANAYANTRVALAGTEDGATISKTDDTERGVWGEFRYTATQAETDHDQPETIVMIDGIVDGLDFRRMNTAGAYTTVGMKTSADEWGDVVIETGDVDITRDDALRSNVRTNGAPFTRTVDPVTGAVTIQYRNMADTKDSHHATLTEAGRVDAGVDDLT